MPSSAWPFVCGLLSLLGCEDGSMPAKPYKQMRASRLDFPSQFCPAHHDLLPRRFQVSAHVQQTRRHSLSITVPFTCARHRCSQPEDNEHSVHVRDQSLDLYISFYV